MVHIYLDYDATMAKVGGRTKFVSVDSKDCLSFYYEEDREIFDESSVDVKNDLYPGEEPDEQIIERVKAHHVGLINFLDSHHSKWSVNTKTEMIRVSLVNGFCNVIRNGADYLIDVFYKEGDCLESYKTSFNFIRNGLLKISPDDIVGMFEYGPSYMFECGGDYEDSCDWL